MTTFDKMYTRIKMDLELTAEDNRGQIPVLELRRIVCERIGTDPRTYQNARDALTMMNKIKPLNQHVFAFLDGEKAE